MCLEPQQTNTSMLIVEFNGFLGNNGEVIIKELVIMPFDRPFNYSKYLFKNPYNLSQIKNKEQVEQLCDLYNLKWEDGEIEYEELIPILKNHVRFYKMVVTTGGFKARTLAGLINRSVTIFPFPTDDSTKYEFPCENHSEYTDQCALVKAFSLRSRLVFDSIDGRKN